jgi:hypothetical protein
MEHGPEWKQVVASEKDKGSPKVQYLYCDKQLFIIANIIFKIREVYKLFKFVKFAFEFC